MNQFKLTGPTSMQAPPPPTNPSAGAGVAPAPGPSAPMAPPVAPEGEAPPPYTTMPRSPSELGAYHWTGPGATGAAAQGAYVPRGVKLGYMDFVPRLVRKRILKDNEYETFE